MGELNSAGLNAIQAKELREKYEAAMGALNAALRLQKNDPMNAIRQQAVDQCRREVDAIESQVRKAAW